jgi:RNA-directed DNA polymerase
MDAQKRKARRLADRLLAGRWTGEAIAAAIEAVLGLRRKQFRALLLHDLLRFGEPDPPTVNRVTDYLLTSKPFLKLTAKSIGPTLAAHCFAPAEPFATLAIPRLTAQGELAAWLDLTIEQLDWLADARRGHRRAEGALQHYHYAFIDKKSGPPRLIEAPKSRLKAIQRRILHEILEPVPVHGGAFGFVPGRSCLGGAQRHAGEAVVAGFDLRHFFPTLHMDRVHGIFRSLGYPASVARLLAGLCTTVTPDAVFLRLPAAQRHDRAIQALYGARHLPQGAPTSPALANLAAWQLDRRLDGLARAAGANYTRYADDLTFSGDAAFARRIDPFGRTVETIVVEEGFALNLAKSRVMPRGTQQRVTGIIVNEHCNIARTEFDRLKAILHNCVRHGPAGQNRDSVADFRRHLDGRIAWVAQVNPRRAEKLRRDFDRIAWE